MPEFVKDLNGLVSNVREYQRALMGTSTRINPRLVLAWYYVPALNMVAASRFIGYHRMTGELYDIGGISGSETEAYLRSKGWFRQIETDDPIYPRALELVNLLCSGGLINPNARISVLREEYDQIVSQRIKIGERQFWVISPNVDGTGKMVDEWKREILLHPAAMLGWGPKDTGHGGMGPRFKNKVQQGDVILIARGKRKVDMVGFGVVNSGLYQEHLSLWNEPVWTRELSPFKSCSEAPDTVSLIRILQHSYALVQLHPETNQNHKTLCNWMETELGLTANLPNNRHVPGHKRGIYETDLVKSGKFGYTMKTKGEIKKAREIEKRLLYEYQAWLGNKNRNLVSKKYNMLQCDAWENDRSNLIEAKGYTSRENIRMAAGQLLDYAFQFRDICQQPHMAILLPKHPGNDRINWLEPLDIKIVWRRGNHFSTMQMVSSRRRVL